MSNKMGLPLGDAEMVKAFLADVDTEAREAMNRYARFNSAHEGYAVLLEEVDELWEHVRKRQGTRDVDAMRKECVQIAAMALRFGVDLAAERGQR